MNLKLEPNEQGAKVLSFGKPIFPKSGWIYDDALGKKIDVIGGDFTVYLPFTVAESSGEKTVVINIGIVGAVCSNTRCSVPDFGSVKVEVKVKPGESAQPNFTLSAPQKSPALAGQWADYSIWAALVLAFVAGLSLNIMPCVWPVLPIIVMRLVEQAKEGKSKSIVNGACVLHRRFAFLRVLSRREYHFETRLQHHPSVGRPVPQPCVCRGDGDAYGGACVIYVRPVYDYRPLVNIGQKRLRQRIRRRGGDGFSGSDTQHAVQFRDIGGGVRLGTGTATGACDACDNGNRNRYGDALRGINRDACVIEQNAKARPLDGIIQADHWLCASCYCGQTYCCSSC